MRRILFPATALAVASLASLSQAAEVRIAADPLQVNAARGQAQFDLVLHAAGLATDPGETFAVSAVRVVLWRGDRRLLERTYSPEDVARDGDALRGARLPIEVAGQVLNPDGLAGFFGRPVALASGSTPANGEAVLLTRRYLAVDERPDRLAVIFEGVGADGGPAVATATVAAAPTDRPIVYRMPLQGVWLLQAGPTVTSHHRFNPPTEFAVDFFKVDERGGIYSGDSGDAANAMGFGAPVLAAADGVVVDVVDDDVQDRAAFRRRPGETPQAYGERVGGLMMARARTDPRRAFAGNRIVIRHERGGVVEYSTYGHLRTDSARVRVGDRVAGGEVIAEVGDTGDSPAPHLHFQLNAGPDPFTSASLPVTFVDMKASAGNAELGRFVAPGPAPAGP